MPGKIRISIREKLLLYILVSIFLFAGLLFLVNTFFMEAYYLGQKKNTLLQSSQKIQTILEDAQIDLFQVRQVGEAEKSVFTALSRIERTEGQSVYLGNDQGIMFYPMLTMSTSAAFSNTTLIEPEQTFKSEGLTTVFRAAESADEKVEKEGGAGEKRAIVKQSEVRPEISLAFGGEVKQNEFNKMWIAKLNPFAVPRTKAGIYTADAGTEQIRNVLKSASPFIVATATQEITGTILVRSKYSSVEPVDSGGFFAVAEDVGLGVSTLRYQNTLENGLILAVSMPITAIAESVAIANQFTTLVGGITLLLAGIWAIFISRRFTRPITQMNQITRQMRDLDFTQTIQVSGKDEISQLAENINMLSASLDTTLHELQEKNEQLAADIDRERKIDCMRREFISSVSHELKTPIFLIQGYAEGLRSQVAAGEAKQQFYYQVISEEAEKMDFLVKDLLLLAQLESGEGTLNRQTFDLVEMLQGIQEKYTLTLQEKDLRLEYRGVDFAQVQADPQKMEQVVTNFLNNALEHVNEKRQLRWQIEPVLGMPEGKHLNCRFSIFNTGPPLSEEAQHQVWNSFYKTDPARTREVGGAGLGLSIVRAILETHGYAYGVVNAEEGVQFWFDFPQYNEE